MGAIKSGLDKPFIRELLLNVHSQQLWSWLDGQLAEQHFSWAGLDLSG